MAMQPKTFKLYPWQARALHKAAEDANMNDGEFLRSLILKHLNENDYNLSDFIYESPTNR
jgi:hypothetical protein